MYRIDISLVTSSHLHMLDLPYLSVDYAALLQIVSGHPSYLESKPRMLVQDTSGDIVALCNHGGLPQPHPSVDRISSIRSAEYCECVNIYGLWRFVAVFIWHHPAYPGGQLQRGRRAATILVQATKSNAPEEQAVIIVSSGINASVCMESDDYCFECSVHNSINCMLI